MSELNIWQRLSDARREFHGMKLKKTGYNEYSKYDYYELGDILLPGMQVLRNHGLVTTPVSYGLELATMTVVCPETGEAFELTSPMSTAKLKACHEVQNLGAVQTYLRRYLWIALLEIVEHDGVEAVEAEEPEPLATAEQWAQIGDYRAAGQTDNAIEGWLEKNGDKLTEAQAERCIAKMKGLK